MEVNNCKNWVKNESREYNNYISCMNFVKKKLYQPRFDPGDWCVNFSPLEQKLPETNQEQKTYYFEFHVSNISKQNADYIMETIRDFIELNHGKLDGGFCEDEDPEEDDEIHINENFVGEDEDVEPQP